MIPRTVSPQVEAAARAAFAYLSATDPLPPEPADAVLGFGTFDLALASFCGELYLRGAARRIIFTGGIGAGTADLGRPEADAWRDELRRTHPGIPAEHVIVENRSTNTTENIEFTAALLRERHAELSFGAGLRRALIIAAPSRLRRARLALRQKQPAVQTWRQLPSADFDRERRLHDAKGIPFLPHLAGELDRIVNYPAKGWIAGEPLPPDVAAARHLLAAPP